MCSEILIWPINCQHVTSILRIILFLNMGCSSCDISHLDGSCQCMKTYRQMKRAQWEWTKGNSPPWLSPALEVDMLPSKVWVICYLSSSELLIKVFSKIFPKFTTVIGQKSYNWPSSNGKETVVVSLTRKPRTGAIEWINATGPFS